MDPKPTTALVLKPIDRLKVIISAASVQEQFRNALGDAAPLFAASLIDAYGASRQLQECDPGAVVQEALKAAVLRLPLNRNLGFAYIVPRQCNQKIGGEWVKVWTPQMQIGWKGYVQLGQRTGQYRYINADFVMDGETVHKDRMSGAVTITGVPKPDGEVIGFFAYIELLNGFCKATYWTVAELEAHRDRYVPKWNTPGGAWVTHPGAQATKTVLSDLLRKYGVMSVEMQRAVSEELGEWPEAPEPDAPAARTPSGKDRMAAALGIVLDEPAKAPSAPAVQEAEFTPDAYAAPAPEQEQAPAQTQPTETPAQVEAARRKNEDRMGQVAGLLAEADEPMTCGEVAKQIGLTTTQTAGVLDRLYRKGAVTIDRSGSHAEDPWYSAAKKAAAPPLVLGGEGDLP